jgi:hypothetical protein
MDKQNNDCKVIKATKDGITEFRTIFWWNHHRGEKKSHCLLRLFVWDDESRVVVVCVKLKSNLTGYHILTIFKELSETVLNHFKNYIKVPMDKVEWFIHYGGFSSHDGVGGETLSKADTKNVVHFDDYDMPKSIVIQKRDFKKYLEPIELGKIRPILKELNWELIDRMSDADYE